MDLHQFTEYSLHRNICSDKQKPRALHLLEGSFMCRQQANLVMRRSSLLRTWPQ